MKLKTTIFSLEVQISKPDRYWVEIVPVGFHGDSKWLVSFKSSSYFAALFKAWRLGREMALFDQMGQTIVIFNYDEQTGGVDRKNPVRVGTMRLHMSIKYKTSFLLK